MADSYEYLQQALNIKNYTSLYCLDFNQPINMHFFTKRPPLYGLFILIFKTVFNSNFSVLLVQNILSFLNIIGLIKLLDKFNFSFDFKKLILALLICLPVQFIYANMIMSEILLQTLLFWSFYFFLLYLETNRINYIFLYNTFLALAVLTKPVLVYFWIPNLLLLAYMFFGRRKPLIIISGLIMPLAIFSLSLYNYYTTGSFHYSSSKHINLVGYNSAFLFVKVYGEEEGIKRNIEVRKHLDSIKEFPKLINEEEKIGYGIIMNHKYEYMKFYIGGMLNFFMDPGRFDLNNFLGIIEGNNTGLLYTFTKEGYPGVFKFILKEPIYVVIYISLMILINVILLISLIGFLFVKRIKTELKVYVFVLIFYLCFFSGPLGTMRYKVHILPLLIFTVPFLLEKIKAKPQKQKTTIPC
ncbi:MAG: glycosyltransferase family 39 protein [Ignavibacteriae bacterium]|nr:glycosyltransferase family 39 protein [Ignavibacteriota bacterium]